MARFKLSAVANIIFSWIVWCENDILHHQYTLCQTTTYWCFEALYAALPAQQTAQRVLSCQSRCVRRSRDHSFSSPLQQFSRSLRLCINNPIATSKWRKAEHDGGMGKQQILASRCWVPRKAYTRIWRKLPTPTALATSTSPHRQVRYGAGGELQWSSAKSCCNDILTFHIIFFTTRYVARRHVYLILRCQLKKKKRRERSWAQSRVNCIIRTRSM